MLKCIFCIKQLFGTRTLLFSEQRPLQRVWLLYSLGRSCHVCSAWAECLMSSRVGWYNYVGPRVWTLQYSTVNYSIIQYSTVLQVDKSDKIALLVGIFFIKIPYTGYTESMNVCRSLFTCLELLVTCLISLVICLVSLVTWLLSLGTIEILTMHLLERHTFS